MPSAVFPWRAFFFALFSGQTVISCPVAIERVLPRTSFSLMFSAKIGILVQMDH